MTTGEENQWKVVAAAYDEGKGLILETADSVRRWLVEDRQVPQFVAVHAEAMASKLFAGGYVFPSSLFNIRQELHGSLMHIPGPFQVILFNKLKDLGPIPQQQQQSCAASCILVYFCRFNDEGNVLLPHLLRSHKQQQQVRRLRYNTDA